MKSVKRIDRLTEAQKAQMKPWADKWIGIGLRTGETDWERFEGAARECYRFAGLNKPKIIIRVSSPIVGAFAAPIAASLIAFRPWDKIPTKRAVESAVESAVGSAVESEVGSAVESAVRSAVESAVESAVRSEVYSAVYSGRIPFWHYWIGGQFWPSWGFGYWGAAYTSYFREVCGLNLPGNLTARSRAYEATIQSACYWWPNKDFVMVCARPRSIHRDAQGRLHNEHEPAIDWPDGWGVYSIHGVRVPTDVVEHPESINAARINAEPNAEVRRIMLDRFGMDQYLASSKAEQIHKDDWGTLWRIPAPNPADEPLVLVEVVNSTPEPDGHFKHYTLCVPPATKTAREAVEWTFHGEPWTATVRAQA